jgi:beta-glucanase (GH16 family)
MNMKKLLLFIFILSFFTQSYSQKYIQVWGDEFNTPGLPDNTKWDFEIGKLRNGEEQYYTKRSENARIQDTTLIIELRKENYMGAAYTSASLISKYKGDWLYGKFEFSAKVPTGKGTWPALWMLPSENYYGGWPQSGEIDIMEYVGMNPDDLYYTVHYEGTNGSGHQSSGTKNTSIKQPYNQFIKFAIIWSPTKIEWFANDKKTFTYLKSSTSTSKNGPFNKMFYLIMNLAYGGGWGGQQGLDDSKLPHKFYIDYVRVYQLQTSDGPFSIELKQATGGTAEIIQKQDNYPAETLVTLTAKANEGYEFDRWTDLGFQNPMTFKVINNTVVAPVFKKKNEQITNGDFSDGLRGWGNWAEVSASPVFTTAAIDSVFVATITKSGTADWHIVTQQLGLSISKDTEYIVKFDAWADTPNTMDVFVSKNSGDYGTYYSTVKNITKTKTTYTWKFKMLKATDNNCRFGFGYGKFKGKVYIDNVSIEKVVPTAINDLDQIDELKVFPNPTSGEFIITNETSKTLTTSLSLYNIQGQLVAKLNDNLVLESGEQLGFNLNDYQVTKGVYLLTVTGKNRNFTQKLIVN